MYKSLRLLLIFLLGCNMSSFAQTFSLPGTYLYTVPAGVIGINVNVKGATGGQNSDEFTYPDRAGNGGCVQAIITVTPGQVLQLTVGGAGGTATPTTGGAGGFNGGGAGTNALGAYSGGGGGGASDIQYPIGTRIVVGGGGGGAGENCSTGDADRGGDGGTTTGENGFGCGTVTGGGGGNSVGPTGGAPGVCIACLGSTGTAGGTSVGGSGGPGSASGGGGGGYGAGGGGWWSGGGGGADYTDPSVFPVSDTRGCNAGGNGSIAISIYCKPGTIAGPDSICVGGTGTYTDVAGTGGGTWSTYFGYATIGTAGVATGVTAGVDTIIYTLAVGSPGCKVVKPITVNPVPSAITGPTFVCQNSIITLSESDGGGTWSTLTPGIATVGSTGVVLGISPGGATIAYTFPTGCSTLYSVLVNPVPSPISAPDSMVCEGSTLALTDPDGGGTWSSTLTGVATVGPTTGIVSGVASGVTIISYTVGLCAATQHVTVNPLPAGIGITGGGLFRACQGYTVTMTDITPLGTWSSGTPAVGTIDPVTGVFTPGITGTTSICYTLSTGCQRCVTLTVNALPTPPTGASVVCEASSFVLTDVSSGTWLSSNPAIATATPAGPGTTTTVAGVGIAGGVVNITYTAPATGCFVLHPVTVNPRPPVITGPDPVCVGTLSTEVSDVGPGWSSVGTLYGTINPVTGVFTATAGPGLETIQYTYPTTGCFRIRVMTVNPNPAPITGVMQVCVGATTVLNDVTVAGTWTSPDDPTLVSVVGVGTTGNITGNAAGVATISYTLPTTCFAIALVTVNPNPNPITGTVTQLCDGDSTLLTETTPGGTWSSTPVGVVAIGTAGMVTTLGTTGAVVTISYTLPTGCYATYVLTVSATPSPFTPVHSMCLNDIPLNLLSGGGAGTWTSKFLGIATITPAGGTVTPVSVGVDSICFTFTAAPGCFRCEEFTVNALPPPITGPNTVCVGKTITDVDGPPPGTWTTFRGRATVGPLTGVVLGVTPGTDSVIYTIATGCKRYYPVTVNASPPAIGFTSLNVCLGQTLNLTETAPPFGGAWSEVNGTGGATIAPAGLNCVVTGTAAVTATVNYTIPDGCAASVVVTVSTLATSITGPNNVCTGSTITLSNAAGAGTWTSSAPGVASVTAGPPSATNVISGVSPGTAVITFNYLGCATTMTITVNATPVALITPLGTTDLCPGGIVALTASTGPGYTYQWYQGPLPIVGAVSSTYTTGIAGAYTVHVATAFCSNVSAPVNITVNPVTATSTPGSFTGCASTPPTLTAGPIGAGYTYQWELGSVPITGAVASTYSATVSGVYNVVVTNSFGCSGTSPVSIVNLVPSPAGTLSLSGPATFCAGSSLTMTTDIGAGYTYQWYVGGIPIAGATNVSYTATAAGSYKAVVTNTTGCSTTTVTTIVAVTAAPPATIVAGGDTTFCIGGSVTLGAPGGPGLTFQWYSNGVIIPGATTPSYIATTTGNYTVKVTSGITGCSATSAVKVVTVVAIPYLHPVSATTFCWGGSVTLDAIVTPGAGAVTYQWFRNTVLIPGAVGSSYVAANTGSYTVQVTVPGAIPCTMTSPAVSVVENPLPNPLVTFDGVSLHTGTFVTYQWYKDALVIPGATSSSTVATGNGTYKVVVTDVNGCQSVSANFVLTSFTSTGINNATGNGPIKIYPNPAQTMVHIEAQQWVRAVISGIDGRTVIDQPAAKDIDITHLADGMYMIKLYDQSGQMLKAEKLVKATN